MILMCSWGWETLLFYVLTPFPLRLMLILMMYRMDRRIEGEEVTVYSCLREGPERATLRLWEQFWAKFLWLTLCLENHSSKENLVCEHSHAGRLTSVLEFNVLSWSHSDPLQLVQVLRTQGVKVVHSAPHLLDVSHSSPVCLWEEFITWII